MKKIPLAIAQYRIFQTDRHTLAVTSASNSRCYLFLVEFFLEYGCFIMLCQFRLYSKLNQPYAYTYIPSFLDFLSIQVTKVQKIEFPVLQGMFSLVIYFVHSINSIYVSIPRVILISHNSFQVWFSQDSQPSEPDIGNLKCPPLQKK